MIIYVHLRSTFAVKTLKNTCKSTAMDSISMIPGISTCFHSIQSTSQPSENYRGKILLSADAVGFGRATCRATWFPTVLQRSQVMSYPGKPPPKKKKKHTADEIWQRVIGNGQLYNIKKKWYAIYIY